MKRVLLFAAAAALTVGLCTSSVFAGPVKPPAPTYCPECQPCTTNRDCGLDPQSLPTPYAPLGFCNTSSTSNYCHKAYVCNCY